MAVYSLSGQLRWPGTHIPNVACEEVQYETSIGIPNRRSPPLGLGRRTPRTAPGW